VTNTQTAAQLSIAQIQGALYGSQIAGDTQLEGEQLNDEYNINSQVVGEVGAAGLNHGTSQLEDTLAGILGDAEGEEGSASTAFGASGSIGVSQANNSSNAASIINSIGNLGTKVVSAL
jgi:hypothetical protein